MTGPLIPSPFVSTPLVSTQWLADHLGADKLVVLDATVLLYTQPSGRPGYQSGHESYVVNGHVPGAVFADVIGELSDTEAAFPFTKPDADTFAAAVGALGIDNETTVVVYDSVAGQWAARVWWLFRSFGYDAVAVLDGGLTAWIAEGRETEVGHVEPSGAVFVAHERPESWVSSAEVQAIVNGDAPGVLVCGMPAKEFSGETGRTPIPGSINIPVGALVNRESNRLLAGPELRATLAPVLDADRIITYCSGGIAAASDALALVLVGHTNVALYDGSLNEWAAVQPIR
ncbi:MAG: sulfurtransferase [Salinibacterium sp.]|nr:sulfurtransferase [Salinibacterium sp.]